MDNSKGLIECDACGRYFPEHVCEGDEMVANVIKSDILSRSKFCSRECRDEAEQAAEDARGVSAVIYR